MSDCFCHGKSLAVVVKTHNNKVIDVVIAKFNTSKLMATQS
jgi:hypothetical protein